MNYSLTKIFVCVALLIALASCSDDPTGSDDNGDDAPSNEAPSAVADADPESADVGKEVILDASSSSDPDDDDLSYEWDLTTPDGSSAELSDDQAESPTFTPDEAGDYVAELTVDDGNGETDQDEVTVTVESNVVEVSNNITEDETWTDDALYRVTDAIDIRSSATLTIEAGVTVEFEANAGLWVDSDNSALITEGTETDSVTFTGTEKEAGFWRGIGFDSNNPSNKLEFTVVEYGGYENWNYVDEAANVALRDGDSNVTISNSTLRYSSDFGLFADGGSNSLPDFGNNTFTDNEIPVGIATPLMGLLDKRSNYTGNSSNYVLVEEQNVLNDMTVSALDVPYRVENAPDLRHDAQVTIEAGATLEFTANAGIRVDSDNAALIAEGTSDDPVTFTGVEQEAGFWRGIAFESDHPDNKLEHTVVEYGGYEPWPYIDEAANVALRSGGANVAIINSTLQHSGDFGLYAEGGVTFSDFSNNIFSDNEIPVGIHTPLMGAMDSESTFRGNTGDYVLVEEQNVLNEMAVSTLDVPYRIENAPDLRHDAQVTIEAGATLEFTANAGIRVDSDNAALIAEGTSDDPVTFTGVEEEAGYWRGIAFESDDPNNKLDYTVIEYGGYEPWPYIDEAANISLREGAQLTLTNSTIRNSDSYGGWGNEGTGTNITESGNSYSNNPDGHSNY